MKATLNHKKLRHTYVGNERKSDRFYAVLIWFDCDTAKKAVRAVIKKTSKDYGCILQVTYGDEINLEADSRGETASEAIFRALLSVGITFDQSVGVEGTYTRVLDVFGAIGKEIGVQRGSLIIEGVPIHKI